MKLIYILSLGHSGSTLLDVILGTHPDFLSTGESRYLGWQLYRTIGKKASIKDQDICTCGHDFRECEFWSEVIRKLYKKTGIDISRHPKDFKNYFFESFKYNDKISFYQKIKGYLTRQILELGLSMSYVNLIAPEVNEVLKNNWILYEIMSDISNKKYIVNSSKNLVEGLLFQKSRPSDVIFIFIHRSLYGLWNSSKRWSKNDSIKNVALAKKVFENRIKKYKNNIKDLNYIEVDYEEFAAKPATVLDKIVNKAGATNNYIKQSNNQFYIDPSQLHLVAGNPMRYKGKQLVKYDERWKHELSTKEKNIIKQYIKDYNLREIKYK